ncbi:hypothetical protein HID58_042794, partial [Brassica napus]
SVALHHRVGGTRLRLIPFTEDLELGAAEEKRGGGYWWSELSWGRDEHGAFRLNPSELGRLCSFEDVNRVHRGCRVVVRLALVWHVLCLPAAVKTTFDNIVFSVVVLSMDDFKRCNNQRLKTGLFDETKQSLPCHPHGCGASQFCNSDLLMNPSSLMFVISVPIHLWVCSLFQFLSLSNFTIRRLNPMFECFKIVRKTFVVGEGQDIKKELVVAGGIILFFTRKNFNIRKKRSRTGFVRGDSSGGNIAHNVAD